MDPMAWALLDRRVSRLVLAGLTTVSGITLPPPAHAGLAPPSTSVSSPTGLAAGSGSPAAGSDCVWAEFPGIDTGSPHNAFYGVAAIAPDDVWAVGAYAIFSNDAKQIIQRWDGSSWTRASTPSLAAPNQLLAISAVSADDVWAVGGYDEGGQALIEHWDGSSWSVVPHPNPAGFNRFFGVAAISSRDVWAVGQTSDGGLARTLVEHWDGTSWSVVPSPNVPNQHNQLNAVTAVPGSPSELWAVGQAGPSALILHWNGTQWNLVPSPDAGPVPIFTGVVALSSDDVWAVGWTSAGSGPITLTEHWDGSAWSVVPSPNPGPTFNYLWAVGAVASNEVWAVGEYIAQGGKGRTLILRWNGTSWAHVPGDDTGPIGLSFSLKAVSATGISDVWSVGSNSHSLTEHWNGSDWSIVSSPDSGIGDNILHGVSGTGPADVWEVGYSTFGTEHRTLIEHWDGTQWRLVRSPNTNKRLNELRGVHAISPADAWAVGSASSGGADQTTLTLHWDGSNWNIVPSPSPGTAGLNELHAVSASSATDVWAVGNYTNSGGYIQALVVHWDGTSWSIVPAASVPGENSGFYGVVSLAPDDVWAVGYRGVVELATLIQHWDGSTWSVVPSPDPQVSSNILRGVSATGPNDVWAVGTARNLYTFMTGGLIEHWDGNDWSLVNGAGGPLYGAAATSPDNAWAVGDTSSGGAWIGHWNGNTWESVASPSLAGRLHAVAAVTPGVVWAVGQQYVPHVGYETLNLHLACDVGAFCTCDAGGGCANPDPTAGCANSTGAGASLHRGGGSTSVAADDLVLSLTHLPPNKFGLFYMGAGQTQLPFGDGLRCVGTGGVGIFRFNPAQSSGDAGLLTLGPGIVTRSQSFPANGHIDAGETWYFQGWYRDPMGPCGTGFNLSNGLTVSFAP